MNLNFKEIDVLVEKEKAEENYEEVIVEPLETGFGITIGNAMRRIMLSSMPGAAVIGFHIDGVSHELMSIDGTSNDTLELISALKKLRFSMEGTKDVVLTLDIKKAGQYFAKDLKLPKGVTLNTPGVHLLDGTGKKDVKMELLLRKSRSNVEAREHKNIDDKYVQIDGLFSPIKKVAVNVTDKIVDGDSSFETLRLSVTTDGSITAKEAISIAATIAKEKFARFDHMEERKTELEIYEEKEKERVSIDNTTIEELSLSVRSTNALRNAGVENVGQLRKVTETQLKDFKNMGVTSVEEVKEVLKKLKVQLGDY